LPGCGTVRLVHPTKCRSSWEGPCVPRVRKPLDRWLVLRAALTRPRRTESMLAQQSLEEVVGALARILPSGASGLGDGSQPGHTPVSCFFRPRDRVLSPVMLAEVISIRARLVLRRQEVAGRLVRHLEPRWAKRSAAVLPTWSARRGFRARCPDDGPRLRTECAPLRPTLRSIGV